MVGYLAALLGESPMEEQQIGWIAAIIIGGMAGWLAEQFMKSQMGFLMNIVLGIVGPPLLVGCSACSVSRSAVGSAI